VDREKDRRGLTPFVSHELNLGRNSFPTLKRYRINTALGFRNIKFLCEPFYERDLKKATNKEKVKETKK
jgi:hypothetical protein